MKMRLIKPGPAEDALLMLASLVAERDGIDTRAYLINAIKTVILDDFMDDLAYAVYQPEDAPRVAKKK